MTDIQKLVAKRTPPEGKLGVNVESRLVKRKSEGKAPKASKTKSSPPNDQITKSGGEETLPLINTKIYFDVYSGKSNMSETFGSLVKELGANVQKSLRKDCSLVVWKDGSQETLNKAKDLKIPVVNTLWVQECYENCYRAQYKQYEVPETSTGKASGTKNKTTNWHSPMLSVVMEEKDHIFERKRDKTPSNDESHDKKDVTKKIEFSPNRNNPSPIKETDAKTLKKSLRLIQESPSPTAMLREKSPTSDSKKFYARRSNEKEEEEKARPSISKQKSKLQKKFDLFVSSPETKPLLTERNDFSLSKEETIFTIRKRPPEPLDIISGLVDPVETKRKTQRHENGTEEKPSLEFKNTPNNNSSAMKEEEDDQVFAVSDILPVNKTIITSFRLSNGTLNSLKEATAKPLSPEQIAAKKKKYLYVDDEEYFQYCEFCVVDEENIQRTFHLAYLASLGMRFVSKRWIAAAAESPYVLDIESYVIPNLGIIKKSTPLFTGKIFFVSEDFSNKLKAPKLSNEAFFIDDIEDLITNLGGKVDRSNHLKANYFIHKNKPARSSAYPTTRDVSVKWLIDCILDNKIHDPNYVESHK